MLLLLAPLVRPAAGLGLRRGPARGVSYKWRSVLHGRPRPAPGVVTGGAGDAGDAGKADESGDGNGGGSGVEGLPFADAYHTPVMVAEVLDALVWDPNGVYVDGTLGGGGHRCAPSCLSSSTKLP
jgi:hypothetical protein